MKKTFFEEFLSDDENQKLYHQEGLIVEFAEMVVELMEQKGIKKKDIARKLDVSASQITQWLDGSANLQLRTVSDILFTLDSKLKMEAEALKDNEFQIENISKDWSQSRGPLHGRYGSSHLKYINVSDSGQRIAV